MINAFKDFVVIEEQVSYYELAKPPAPVTYSYEFDFKNAESFCSGNNERITFKPKIGDQGSYKFKLTLNQYTPVSARQTYNIDLLVFPVEANDTSQNET